LPALGAGSAALLCASLAPLSDEGSGIAVGRRWLRGALARRLFVAGAAFGALANMIYPIALAAVGSRPEALGAAEDPSRLH
jgi:hypothetical protein